MSQFADIRTEWRVSDIEHKLNQKSERYEVDSISSDVHRLEHSLQDSCFDISQLRNEFQTLQEQFRLLQDQFNQITYELAERSKN